MAIAFFVFVIATTAPGSVDMFCSVDTAASRSASSFLTAHVVKKERMVSIASLGLLAWSDERFWSVWSASNRSSAVSEFPKESKVPTMPSYGVNFTLFAGNLVRLKRNSRHRVWIELEVSLATRIMLSNTEWLLHIKGCVNPNKEAVQETE